MTGGGAGGISGGNLLLGGPDGHLVLRGNWEFRAGDNPSYAQWPRTASGTPDRTVAVRFFQGAGKGFGKEPDYSPLAGTKPLKMFPAMCKGSMTL